MKDVTINGLRHGTRGDLSLEVRCEARRQGEVFAISPTSNRRKRIPVNFETTANDLWSREIEGNATGAPISGVTIV